GWDHVAGGDLGHGGLAAEAIYLGRLVTALLPEEPEARGLLALMLHCEARRPARRSAEGSFVPLGEQDVTLWSAALAHEAEGELATAGGPGRGRGLPPHTAD